MPEASDKGSQPYRNAVRCFEMAGKAIPHTQNLAIGKGHTQLMSPTQGQADIIGDNSIPAISQPLWGCCMAGYHCLMPTAFLPVRNNPYLSYCSFFLH